MNGNTQVPHQYPSQSHTLPIPPMNNQPSYAYAYAYPPSSSSSSSSSYDQKKNPADLPEKWGNTTSHHHVMGGAPPGVAFPTYNPNNPKASLWMSSSAGDGDRDRDQNQYQQHHIPYLQYSPVEKPPTNTMNHQMESVLHKVNSWGNKANTTANNIWHNLKTGSSVSGAAWEKLNVTAKAIITEGGFESLYKQSFATFPNEKLNKSFASYLSTSTGPIAGTLYLSNLHIAFCSDTPISFTSPSGQQTWSYYKVMAPLGKIGTINPIVIRNNPSEKYIQIVTVDGHDFWFMGFVNYEKASRHLTESICKFVASGIAVPPHHPMVA